MEAVNYAKRCLFFHMRVSPGQILDFVNRLDLLPSSKGSRPIHIT